MSKRKQPERSVKKPNTESKKGKKGKKEKVPKTTAPKEIPIKKVKVENSALDQLKTVFHKHFVDD